MTTFAIIAPAAREDLKLAVAKAFGMDWYEFSPGQFVGVSENLTTQGVVNAIGGKGEVGQVVVFQVSGYWGFHTKALWDWLATKGVAA